MIRNDREKDGTVSLTVTDLHVRGPVMFASSNIRDTSNKVQKDLAALVRILSLK